MGQCRPGHGSRSTGYDTLPIDSMQGLEISSPVGGGGAGGAPGNGGAVGGASGGGGNIGAIPPSGAPTSPYSMDMDVGEIDAGALNFDLDAMPTPPNDNNNLAAWYDTDC